MSNPTSRHRRLFFAIFTLSGFSGLIYEAVWSHYLKLFLGHAAYAQTLVLAIFMGGMALGSWLMAALTGHVASGNLAEGRVLWEKHAPNLSPAARSALPFRLLAAQLRP